MRLPLFPLHLVLFPGAPLPLHIFEMRYKAMMETVLASAERTFGVIAIRSGMEAGGPAETFSIGTIARVEQVQRSSDGTMNIIVAGTDRFHLDERLPDDPFPVGEVSVLDDELGEVTPDDVTSARAALHRYLSVVAKLQGSDVVAPPVGTDLAEGSYALSSALLVDIAERQRLLECKTAAARLQLLTELARREAVLLEAVGPSVGRPGTQFSLN
jgi:uncharacterized protein